eukprot:2091132-Alexandrium_andersonii.AAC.1
MAKAVWEPTPSWTTPRSEPRQRAARASQKPGARQKSGTPTRRAQPWRCRASRGAPRAGC